MKTRGALHSAASLLVGLLLATACPGAADAQDRVSPRRMGVVWRAQVPHIYYSARDLLNGRSLRKLESGLPQRIAVQHFAYTRRRKAPIAVAGVSCKVVYDLWQESYRVEREVLGSPLRVHLVQTRAEVLELCLVFRNVPVGTAGDYAGRRTIHVASLIEFNPLSTSTIARIRRWLSRPRGDYNLEGRSFFGSFVSLFVNDRIGSAERQLRLRSQDIEIR